MKSRGILASVVMSVLVGTTFSSFGQAADPGGPDSASPPEETAMVAAYVRDYPNIGEDEARRAALGQGSRDKLLERIAGLPGFGGAWYDPRSNSLHVYSVNSDFKKIVLEAAAGDDFDIVFATARSSYADLQQLAAQINGERSEDQVQENSIVATVDGSSNAVAISVQDSQMIASTVLRYGDDPRVIVKDFSKLHTEFTNCVSRTACGTPPRSGIAIGVDPDGSGPGSAFPTCSLGFTAAATDGSKWIVTAGHCSVGLATSCPDSNGCWGHGQQYFGPMREAYYVGNIDEGRIRKDNSYWATGGYIYNAIAPNSPVQVNYSIQMRGTIVVGDTVCLAAWNVVAGSECGTVLDVTSVQGLVQTSIGSCSGDSGGGWYAVIGSERWAYGIQSRADHGSLPPCHNAGEHSYFSAVPDINAHWDSTSSATIRIEVLP